jgi:hypothetical protein
MSDPKPLDPMAFLNNAIAHAHAQNELMAANARIAKLERELQTRYDAGMAIISDKQDRIKQLEERLEGMREAGDALWYCIRHAKRIDPSELVDAVQEWQEARNNG